MEGSEKFCLRWNDFERNISDGFKELREEKDFFDVTLACEDNQILAHRVIISACSPFFRNVLRRNPHQHPLLYLKGVKYKELLSILNFMYMGEVNVAQEELNSFLSVAEDLKVKGLTQSKQDSPAAAQKDQTKYAKRVNEIPEEVPLPAQMKRQKVSTLPDNSIARPAMMNRMKQPAADIEEVAVIKTETFESPAQHPAFGNSASLGQSQAQLPAENIVSNPVALGDTYVGDETFDYHYDTASYDTEEGGNTNTAVPQDNTGRITETETNKTIKKSIKKIQKKGPVVPAVPKCKVKEEKMPNHSYIRFGSAWQCEQCKTLFSRKSYASEHMAEENKKI